MATKHQQEEPFQGFGKRPFGDKQDSEFTRGFGDKTTVLTKVTEPSGTTSTINEASKGTTSTDDESSAGTTSTIDEASVGTVYTENNDD